VIRPRVQALSKLLSEGEKLGGIRKFVSQANLGVPLLRAGERVIANVRAASAPSPWPLAESIKPVRLRVNILSIDSL